MRIALKEGIYLSFNKEIMLNLLICIVWAAVLLQYAKGIFNRFPFLQDYNDEASFIFVIIPLLLSLPALINKFCLADYIFFFISVLYYLASYIFFPDNAEYLTDNAFTCICCVFPFYFLGRIIDINKWYDIFLFLSSACILMTVFYYFVYAQGNKNMEEIAGDDNMYAAYRLLPHVAFLLWATLEKIRIWKAIITILGIMFLLSCGTRGPFVCLGFLGIIYFFFFMNFKGAIYVKLGIISLSLMILANLTNVIYFLVKTFTGLQLSTRILEKIVAGDLGNDSYRSVLRDKLYEVLGSGEHFWGIGYFGSMQYGIIYSHFLPLDFFCYYGYFMGSILLLLLFSLIGISFWRARGTKNQFFILYLFSISIIKLLLSNTFILEPYFYLLIGVCINEIYNHRLASQKGPDSIC
jgi:hypothetical protein